VEETLNDPVGVPVIELPESTTRDDNAILNVDDRVLFWLILKYRNKLRDY
jgi:hypothetical protein